MAVLCPVDFIDGCKLLRMFAIVKTNLKTNNSDYDAIIRSNPPRNMNVPEGAAYLGISQRKLHELIKARCIRVSRVGSRIILRAVELDKYLEKVSV